VNELIAQVLTHILAFLLLFALVRRFVWGPVLRLIDERQAAIRKDLDAAESSRRQSEALRAQYEEKLAHIEEESRVRINAAIEEGRGSAQEITARARADAQSITEKAQRNIEMEIAKARMDLKTRLSQITLQAPERLLRERLDDAHQRELVSRFVDELEARKA